MAAARSMRVYAIAGLKREARIVAPHVDRIFAGLGSVGVGDKLREAAHEGNCAILSIGIAGGVQPGLRPGTVVVASSVIAEDRCYSTTPDWAAALIQALPDARGGVIASGRRVIGTVSDKAALHRATGALAVDMESHIAAAIAHASRVPLAVVRIVADPAERALPDAVQSLVTPGGGIDAPAVLRMLATSPAQCGALVRAAGDAWAAFRALARCCRLAGPRFRFPDLGELVLDVT